MSDDDKKVKIINLKKDDLLCRENDLNSDLYLVDEGELLVFVAKNSRITPLAKISRDEFIGELSFFDGAPRSAHIVALRPCKILCIPKKSIDQYFPEWFLELSQFVTNQIRITDSVIQEKGIKKKKEVDDVALSIEEQAHYFKIIKKS